MIGFETWSLLGTIGFVSADFVPPWQFLKSYFAGSVSGTCSSPQDFVSADVVSRALLFFTAIVGKVLTARSPLTHDSSYSL